MSLEFLIICYILREPNKSIAECVVMAAKAHSGVLREIETALSPANDKEGDNG